MRKTYSLDVVSNFLGDELGDVLVLGVLDADLISIVGGNLFELSTNILRLKSGRRENLLCQVWYRKEQSSFGWWHFA